MSLKMFNCFTKRLDNAARFTFAGDRYEPIYSPSDEGKYEIYQSGTRDVYAEIQSHAQECDIHVLISRFLNGDTSALYQREGFYGDVSMLPDNVADVYRLTRITEETFDGLPTELKSKFKNVGEFLDMYGSEEFNQIFDDYRISLEVNSPAVENEVEDA